jgi:pyridoxamine 5'-phosphate oxidase-like protein
MDLAGIAPAFVEMAHRIVWATVATVDPEGRPRTRILHPIWQWDGTSLVGWIATDPTSPKAAHLAGNPAVSINYWAPDHDTCTADCRSSWITDDDGRTEVWRRFAEGPEPVGYDPAIVPIWADGPTSARFAGLRLEPWRLRVQPASVLLTGAVDERLLWSG